MQHLPTTPLLDSYSYFSKVPEICQEGEIVLGVDEAGRGPVLGPMVYAVCYCPSSREQELKELGMDDSKQLKEEEREALFGHIEQHSDWIGWGVHVCSPKDISESMLRKCKYNLNALAHDTTIQLLKDTLSKGVKIKKVFIDTVGSPEKYQAKLSDIFPTLKITVAKKADSLYPSVSAASICAKVTRDAILKQWIFAESFLNDQPNSKQFGSGYPGDPTTLKWMDQHSHPVFGFPTVIRFSWSTCANQLEEKGVLVEWPHEKEEEDIRKFIKRKTKSEPELEDDNKENKDFTAKSWMHRHVKAQWC